MKYNKTLSLIFFLSALCLFQPAQSGAAVPGDYDADSKTDIVVARSINGYWHWFIRYATGAESQPLLFGLSNGVSNDTLLAGDYNADGSFEPTVVRTETNGLLNWYSRLLDGSASVTQWGLANDTPLGAKFGISGGTDRVVVRNLNGLLYWYIYGRGNDGLQWGIAGDSIFAADFTSDGVDELVVARKEGNYFTWYIRDLSGGFSKVVSWGFSSDTPLPPTDFSGDGKADIIVSRKDPHFLNHYINYTDLGISHSLLLGLATDTPYTGFFTQAQHAEIAVARELPGSLNMHFVRFALQDYLALISFGLTGDTLVRPDGRGMLLADQKANDSDGNNTDNNGGGGSSSGKLGSVCKQIVPVKQGFLWKPSSDHSGYPREGRPAALFSSSKPGDSCLSVYASDGSELTTMGLYEYSGKYGGRWYSGWGCGKLWYGSKMAEEAKSRTGKPDVYLERGNGACIGPFDPRNRNGAR